MVFGALSPRGLARSQAASMQNTLPPFVATKHKQPARSRSLLPWLAVAALLVWLWHRGSGSGSKVSSVQSAAALPCPLVYQRQSVEDIRSGELPYLLGGQQKPECKQCHSTEDWAAICQFTAGQKCPLGVARTITDAWLQRGYDLALTLTPCDLWPLISGHTVYLLGDSMMLDMFKSSACFLYEFWPSLHFDPVTQDTELQQQLSEELDAQCVNLLGSTRICFIRVDKGDNLVGRVLPLLPRVAAPSDIAVINFGLHHWMDYEEKLATFASYYKEHRAELPRVFWQQTSQQHFANDVGSGEYPGGKPPFQCKKIENFTVTGDGVIELEAGKEDSFHILTGNWRNTAADRVMREAGIRIVQSYNETLWMADFHRDNGAGHECTHFCLPSAPQTWVLNLYRALRDASSLGL